MRVHVATVVELDPSLFSRSVASQTQALLVKPLNLSAVDRKTQESPNFRPRVIIVDGLDECNDSSSHSEILSALSAAVKHSSIPLTRTSVFKTPIKVVAKRLAEEESAKPCRNQAQKHSHHDVILLPCGSDVVRVKCE
ncbi:hypothetical protein BDZ97DRAFT_1918177 [Flammula alnicola]|nr:hypothetical protein BDZ97DRAFT_1918177 [Flammula alnicola]